MRPIRTQCGPGLVRATNAAVCVSVPIARRLSQVSRGTLELGFCGMRRSNDLLAKTASVFCRQLIGLEKGERLLVYEDGGSDVALARAIEECALGMGALPVRVTLDSNLSLQGMAEQLERVVSDGYDAICELSEEYFYQSPAWKKARQLGARIYSLSGLNRESFARCVGAVDHDMMLRFGLALKEKLRRATTMQIVTGEGANIECKMAGIARRVVSEARRKLRTRRPWQPRPFVWSPSGLLGRTEATSAFLGGQLLFLGVPKTIRGIAVIDGYVWPPREVGRLEAPISLVIRMGHVVEIAPGSRQAEILSRWREGKSNQIQHFCIGFNPGARLSGKLLEVERMFGCITIGFGTYPFHTDAIVTHPTIVLDGVVLLQNGTFVDRDLAILEQRLLGTA